MSQLESPVLFHIENVMAQGMCTPVSAAISAGQTWMIVGSSGTGKSQFLKSLADLIVHQGEVLLNGVNQQAILPDQWRRQVMYFPAETAWWQDSIAAHFETLPNQDKLQSIGLSLNILQKNPDECSSGEKQRLALLRGLSYQTSILLLDEITANLDMEASIRVELLLQNYLKTPNLSTQTGGGENLSPPQKAIIWISHDVAQRQRMAPEAQHLMFKAERPL
ncbi:MAG TPA: ATP-binding cassette domain-containing protein [Thiomicrorhabdus sp.]|nr:ATP-binding cassette domain-containing protein [Thiomicrorhabdus sp.]